MSKAISKWALPCTGQSRAALSWASSRRRIISTSSSRDTESNDTRKYEYVKYCSGYGSSHSQEWLCHKASALLDQGKRFGMEDKFAQASLFVGQGKLKTGHYTDKTMAQYRNERKIVH